MNNHINIGILTLIIHDQDDHYASKIRLMYG